MDSVCMCERCQSISGMIEEELDKEDPMDFDIDVDLSGLNQMPKTQKAITKIALKKKPHWLKRSLGL